MPPKKERTEKMSVSAQENMVFEYLKNQNRPYSATDVSANLHNKVTKSAAQKILIKLQEVNKIEGRISGKQSVYHIIQNPDETPTAEFLANINAQTQIVHEKISSLITDIKSLRSTLSQLTSSLSTNDLRSRVSDMSSEKADIEARLTNLRSGSVKAVSNEERDKVDHELKLVTNAVGRRKAIVREMWMMIAEASSGDRSELEGLMESFGLQI